MAPSIRSGSYVVVNCWRFLLPPKPGQIVKVKHPRYGDMIKILDHIDNQGHFWLRGDNASSVSMLEIGPLSLDQIVGVVCLNIGSGLKNDRARD